MNAIITTPPQVEHVDVVRARPAPLLTFPAPVPDALPGVLPILLSVEQVAAYLGGVSVSKVWALASAGKLPAPVKIDRITRWRRADLEEWVRSL
jgi:excisionase family DNA binding protein